MKSGTRAGSSTGLVMASLLLIGILAIAPACSGAVSGVILPAAPGLNISNRSPDPVLFPAEARPSPTPVTIFRAELNQSILPGPRYMAFGPSVIEISIDPRILATAFAAVLTGLVIWFVTVRKRNREEDSTAK